MHRSLKAKSNAMIFRFLTGQVISWIMKSVLCLYPVRVWLLRLLGGSVGRHSRLCSISFFNMYKTGFSNFKAGDNVFIGDETMVDLADKVIIGSDTTIAERVLILTHTNVGYEDHPLKNVFPDRYAEVHIGEGVFIGAGALLMPGIRIGNNSAIGAMSLVLEDVEPGSVVAGVPARHIRRIKKEDLKYVSREAASGVPENKNEDIIDKPACV